MYIQKQETLLIGRARDELLEDDFTNVIILPEEPSGNFDAC